MNASIRVPVLLALVALTGSAQADTVPKTKRPRLHIESKQIDFGEAILGTQVKVTVPIWNRGEGTLKISQVKPSCDCTVAGFPKTIAPGKKGLIKLRFDSNKRPAGYQSFRIAIYHNDTKQTDLGGSCTVISLRGEIRTLFRKAPHGAYFGEFIQGVKQVEKTVVVRGQREARGGFTASLKSKLPSYLKVAQEPYRKGVRLRFTLLPHAPLGGIQHFIEFKTNVPKQSTFRVMVTALVNTRITGPRGVNFGPVQRGKGSSRQFGLERRDGQRGIKIAHILYDRSLLSVTTKPLGDVRVEVKIDVKWSAPPGPFGTYVRFLLDDPHQKMVSVPIYGRVLPVVRCTPSAVLLPKTFAKGAELGRVVVRIPKGRTVKTARIVPSLPIKTSILVTTQATRNMDGSPDAPPFYTVVLEATGPTPAAWPKTAQLVLETTVPGEERTVIDLVPR